MVKEIHKNPPAGVPLTTCGLSLEDYCTESQLELAYGKTQKYGDRYELCEDCWNICNKITKW